MTQHEFNHLPSEQKLEILGQSGFVVGEKNGRQKYRLFYCLDDFFVEIKYAGSSVEDIHSYKNARRFSFYQHKHS